MNWWDQTKEVLKFKVKPSTEAEEELALKRSYDEYKDLESAIKECNNLRMWGFIQDAKTVLKKEDQTIKKNSHAEEKIKKKLERIKLLLEKAKSFERFIFRLEENILEKLKKESSKEKLFVAEQLVEKAKTISEFLDGSIEFIDCFKENTKENVSQKSDLLKKKLERIKREIAGFIKLEKKELKMLHE